ncbi:PTS lactose transporter subunit IIB [Enterococcus faecalis]|nr:PTS lactose transporter subunit IIB [Enterococcus faecalis]
MVQMNIQQILEEVGVDTDNFQIDHTDVGSASGDMADYFFVEKTLQDALGSIPAEKIIPLNAIIDYDETKEKVLKVLDDNGIAHQ